MLQVSGHAEFGLPFGRDRLAPIFPATMAARQRSKTIRFKSASFMLEIFGMAKGGKENRRLVSAFERIFGATICHQRESGGENVVTLSDEFFAEVMAHPIPADREAVKILVAAPGVLDLFLWLSYRALLRKDTRRFRSSERVA